MLSALAILLAAALPTFSLACVHLMGEAQDSLVSCVSECGARDYGNLVLAGIVARELTL
jgi:hypothetical protein